MRYGVVGLAVFATTCAGAAPTTPTSWWSQIGGGAAVTEAKNGSQLPFNGKLQAEESPLDTPQHDLVGSGNGTQLGRFTYIAHVDINEATGTGVGTATWTATNGDQISTTATGEVVAEAFPLLTIQEEQIIRGGTGRFAGATGNFTIDRTLNLFTSGSFEGKITLGH
jgi:hypothetical protein